MHINSKMEEAATPLVTIADVCRQLKIGRTTFYRLACLPGFPSALRGGSRVVRYRMSEILDFLTRDQSKPVRLTQIVSIPDMSPGGRCHDPR